MKRILLILLLTCAVFPQTKYFLPVQIESSNGRPINNATVRLYTTGTTTLVATLTYLTGSAGFYYWTGGTSTVPWGDYDVYVNATASAGSPHLTQISIRNGYTVNQVTRDSLTQVLSDSFAVVAPRNLQFKDTTALKAASFDSAGFTVSLKQLSSSNTKGGGELMLRPAAEETVDGIEVFASGNASYEWVRMERIKGLPISAEHGGVVAGNKAVDNAAKIQALVNLSLTQQRDLEFPVTVPDTIFCNSTININSPYTESSMTIRGRGKHRTRIATTHTGDLFRIDNLVGAANGYTKHFKMEDLALVGPGLATSTGAGVWADSTQACNYYNVYSSRFRYGFYQEQANTVRMESCGAAYNKYGFYWSNNVNGSGMYSCVGSYNDSAAVWLKSNGVHLIIDGGEWGHNYVGVSAGTGASFVINNTNFEFTTLAAIKTYNCKGLIIDSRFVGAYVGYFEQNSDIEFYGTPSITGFVADSLYHHIYHDGTGSVKHFSGLRKSNLRIYDDFYDRHIYPTIFTTRPDNGITSADSTVRGNIQNMFYRDGLGRADRLHFYSRLNDTTYTYYNLATGSHILSGPNSGFYTAEDRRIQIEGFKNFVSAAATSTTVQVPLSGPLPDGYDEFYSMQISLQETAGKNITAVLTGFTATKDTANIKVWHTSDTGGGWTFWVHIMLAVQWPFSSF